MRISRWYFLLAFCFTTLALLLSALGNYAWSGEAYVEIGAGYKFKSSAVLSQDNCYYVPSLNDHECGGRNPAAFLQIGYVWDNGWSVHYGHVSHWRDGPPFNDRAETHMDYIGLSKRWTFWRSN